MFEDPLVGIVWTFVYILMFAVLAGIVGFIFYYWRLARSRDKEKNNAMQNAKTKLEHNAAEQITSADTSSGPG